MLKRASYGGGEDPHWSHWRSLSDPDQFRPQPKVAPRSPLCTMVARVFFRKKPIFCVVLFSVGLEITVCLWLCFLLASFAYFRPSVSLAISQTETFPKYTTYVTNLSKHTADSCIWWNLHRSQQWDRRHSWQLGCRLCTCQLLNFQRLLNINETS
jgi:hypothetical protein